jgi:hypothetical protein
MMLANHFRYCIHYLFSVFGSEKTALPEGKIVDHLGSKPNRRDTVRNIRCKFSIKTV